MCSISTLTLQPGTASRPKKPLTTRAYVAAKIFHFAFRKKKKMNRDISVRHMTTRSHVKYPLTVSPVVMLDKHSLVSDRVRMEVKPGEPGGPALPLVERESRSRDDTRDEPRLLRHAANPMTMQACDVVTWVTTYCRGSWGQGLPAPCGSSREVVQQY